MSKRTAEILLFASFVILPGCANNKDLLLDMGGGDIIRLAGAADNFYCDDPAQAGTEKVRTWSIQLPGGNADLCAPKVKASKDQLPYPTLQLPVRPKLVPAPQ